MALIYVSNWSDGLFILDVSVPAAPIQVAHFDPFGGSIKAVTISNGFGYVADSAAYHGGLRVVDLRDPTRPIEVDFLPRPLTVLRTAVSNGRVFVADDELGMIALCFSGLIFADGFDSGDLWAWGSTTR